MQQLLADYLFQYKKCPVAGVGTLAVQKTEAVIFATEKKITPPAEDIVFTNEQVDSSDLEEYIAAQKNINKEEAAYQLNRFGEDIKNLQPSEKIILTNAGEFHKDIDGNITFLPVQLPVVFFKEIFAERIIHPHETHAILVGDTETTNTVMNEYYADEIPSAKSKWWIFAIVIAVAALGAIFFYLNNNTASNTFGISHKNEAASPSKTYQTLP